VVEVAEGRNVDGKSRGGPLTKLGMCTLAFGSEASEQASRRRGVVALQIFVNPVFMRRWTPGTLECCRFRQGVEDDLKNYTVLGLRPFWYFFSRRFEERTVGMDS